MAKPLSVEAIVQEAVKNYMEQGANANALKANLEAIVRRLADMERRLSMLEDKK